jgi:hypothetical protein
MTTCEYFLDSDHAACPDPVVAHVEPKPVGQFAPAALCVHHTFMWTRDHEFHLGSEWSIIAVSPQAARALASVS